MTFRIKVALLAFFAFCTLSLSGQQENTPTINLNWRGISLDETLRGLAFLEGEKVERIAIPNAAFSMPYAYSGPLPIRFVQGTRSAKRSEALNVLAEVSLPIDTKEALFLFDHGGPEGRLRVFPVPLKSEPLLPGQVLAINATGDKIAGFHDGVSFELSPGQSTVFTPDQSQQAKVIQVSVQVATLEMDGWWARINSSYGMTADMRVRLLFRSGPDGAIKVIPLRDRSETATQAGKDRPMP